MTRRGFERWARRAFPTAQDVTLRQNIRRAPPALYYSVTVSLAPGERLIVFNVTAATRGDAARAAERVALRFGVTVAPQLLSRAEIDPERVLRGLRG